MHVSGEIGLDGWFVLGVDGNLLFDILAVYCCLPCSIFQGGVEAGLDGHKEIEALINKVSSYSTLVTSYSSW